MGKCKTEMLIEIVRSQARTIELFSEAVCGFHVEKREDVFSDEDVTAEIESLIS
jgi:hypothetical protein